MPTSSHLRARLLRALATLLFAAATTAQGTYYVNGLTGTDNPAAGSSASTPWKTITYAFAQIPPADALDVRAALHRGQPDLRDPDQR